MVLGYYKDIAKTARSNDDDYDAAGDGDDDDDDDDADDDDDDDDDDVVGDGAEGSVTPPFTMLLVGSVGTSCNNPQEDRTDICHKQQLPNLPELSSRFGKRSQQNQPMDLPHRRGRSIGWSF